jgi:hypothetical protein
VAACGFVSASRFRSSPCTRAATPVSMGAQRVMLRRRGSLLCAQGGLPVGDAVGGWGSSWPGVMSTLPRSSLGSSPNTKALRRPPGSAVGYASRLLTSPRSASYPPITRLVTSSGLSCSQNLNTVNPRSWSRSVVSSSRRRLPSILSRQKSVFVLGSVKWSGHPCQKHPSMKTWRPTLLKVMSARRRRSNGRGAHTRNRYPRRCSMERTARSGPVSRPRLACIVRRVAGATVGCSSAEAGCVVLMG